MKRFSWLVVSLASLFLVFGTVAAQGEIRPDDRAMHGPGAALGQDESSSRAARPDDRAVHGPGSVGDSSVAVRPDDRAWRGVGYAPAAVAVEVEPVGGRDGFDWGDAGIGALAVFGIGLLTLGGTTLFIRHQRVAVT